MNGHVLATNVTYQKMLGYTESEFQGISFLEITHEAYREANWALVTELLEGKRDQFQIEKQYRRIDLKICYCSALDECWVLDERIAEKDQQRTEVAQCPAKGPDEFIDN